MDDVLAPYASHRYRHVSGPLVGKKVAASDGGDVGWHRLGKELPNYLSQGHAVVTTLIDLYRIRNNMPGYLPAGSAPPVARAAAIESAMAARLSGYVRREGHFVPYIQVQEYEALLFSDPHAFERATGHAGGASRIERTLRDFSTPEEVNGEQPPGVRLRDWFPTYDKRIDGLLAAQEIGIPAMRAACPRFDAWLSNLGL